jgi:glycosyltransferase involved in cell wall biosynthesis
VISVLVLTRNEELDLPGCLESVNWSDDVHVFDSCSDDRTVEIARRAGAHVTVRPFDNFAAQRNAALRQCAFRHPWVLILDADERVPRALAEEMRAFVATAPSGVCAARMRRRDYLYGTWLKHAQMSPYYIRLVRPERVHYEREVNEVLNVDGGIRDLHAPFDHYPFSKGMEHWLAKHNLYSTLEAQVIVKMRRVQQASLAQALFARDFNERRVHQKALFYRMPLRPTIRFLYSYVVRLGLLDGRAGFVYAALQGIYEYFIVLKTREIDRAAVRPARDEAESDAVGPATGPAVRS